LLVSTQLPPHTVFGAAQVVEVLVDPPVDPPPLEVLAPVPVLVVAPPVPVALEVPVPPVPPLPPLDELLLVVTNVREGGAHDAERHAAAAPAIRAGRSRNHRPRTGTRAVVGRGAAEEREAMGAMLARVLSAFKCVAGRRSVALRLPPTAPVLGGFARAAPPLVHGGHAAQGVAGTCR
jgi:hypothetical protein